MAYLVDATISLDGMADQEVREQRDDQGSCVLVTEWVRELGVHCSRGGHGWFKRNETALAHLGQPCPEHKGHTYVATDETYARNQYRAHRCAGGCGMLEGAGSVELRYSLGLYAGYYCDACWPKSGYRDEPASAFDELDAGERYEDDY